MKIKKRRGERCFYSNHRFLAQRRGGSVIVIVALSMIALCGFGALAVDYSILVSDANRLQRAADAGALAGAAQLKKTGVDATDTANARLVASNMVAQNGIANFDSSTITFSATNDRITVPTTTRRNFFFAPVLRLIDRNSATSGQISRRATAGHTTLAGVPGVAPLAITTTDYYKYKNGTEFDVGLIRNHDEDFDPGDLVGMDLRLDNNGKSGAVFQDDVLKGVSRTAQINEINNAINSSMNSQGAKLLAISTRIALAKLAPWYDTGTNYTYPNYPPNDPRVMTIVVANPTPKNNNNPLIETQFFITVYVQDIDANLSGLKGKNKEGPVLTLKILPPTLYSSDRGDITVGSSTTPAGGPTVISLTE